ncbi:MAG: VOC family protein [Candidatus Micrarchaeaceae archaeon]
MSKFYLGGAQSMGIKNLHNVDVFVSNVKKAKKWYRDKLGMKLIDDQGHWVTFAVSEKDEATLIHLCDEGAIRKGPTGIGFSTDDIIATYKELKKKGVEFTKPPRDEGFGPYAVFKDLDGNEFYLYQGMKE